VTQTRLTPKAYCFFCQYSADEATVPCCSSEQSQYSILHFLQSQTLGWVVIKILFGFKGVPSNPTSFALAEVVGLFTIAKVSHNSCNRQAVMLVTGRCLERQHSTFSNQHLVAQEWVCGGDCPRNRMLAGGAFEFRVQLSNLSQPELDFPDNG
jgi:hypothetical protein